MTAGVLLIKIMIAIKELYKEYKKQRASLTPEERAEWDRDWTEDFKTDESGGTGDGITLPNAIDPCADDGKVNE